MYKDLNELPSSVKKALPVTAQKMFMEAYNNTIQKHDVGTSLAVAWATIQKRLTTVDGKLVANSEDFTPKELYIFNLEPSKEHLFVMNSDTGDIFLEAVLASNEPNVKGRYLDIPELESIAKQINTEGSTLPDIEHEEYARVVSLFPHNPERVIEEMKKRKGIFKEIKAVVDKGKLWIQAKLDKRYKNHYDNFKSLSIEAICDRDGDKYYNPKYVGFTFTKKPSIKGTDIIKD